MRLDSDRNDHRDISKAGEITTALQQTKALRVFHGENVSPAKCFGLFQNA